jgi:hypothetical protein
MVTRDCDGFPHLSVAGVLGLPPDPEPHMIPGGPSDCRCSAQPIGWNLYNVLTEPAPGAKPFGFIAAGDTGNPYYSLVADLDRTPRPRNPRWHVVLRKIKARAAES